MPLNPRTPVLIGWGQINQREENSAVEPVALMATACRRAAPARILEAVDSVSIVNLLSWRYHDPGFLLSQAIGAYGARTRYSGVGGNVPQALVNQACREISQGMTKVAVVAGAETWRTRSRLRARGIRPRWTVQDETIPEAPAATDSVPMVGAADGRIGLDRPAFVYPLFEQAIRIAAGETPDAHRRRIGKLWSRFSAVAAGNDDAWVQRSYAAEEIWRPSTSNRMVSWPYTKLLNSNNMVDQGAALVLTSVQTAQDLNVPREQWVFPHASTEAHDTYCIAERADYSRSPALRTSGRRALELAGTTVDDVDFVDLYSCFPSAVQVAASELGLSVEDADRSLTVTGGLTFAGGPWNNYVTHAIAAMAERIRANPGSSGLINANGGYLTKHCVAVYGSEPPAHEFRWENVQDRVELSPRDSVTEWSGVGTVEAWTTVYDRDGAAERSFLAVRTPGDARALAVITDASVAAALSAADIAGHRVVVRADGTAVLP